MTELQQILATLDELRNTAHPLVLATLVAVEGSAYRLPGARTLFLPDNQRVGTITGPCLEAELLRQSQILTPANSPRLVTYDITADNEPLLGYGLGCKGILHILLEHIDPAHPPAYLQLLRSALAADQPAALATVCVCGDGLGSRLIVADGSFHTSGRFPPDLAAAVLPDARDVLRTSRSFTKTYGQTRVFIEPILPSRRLLILGAGPGSVPLVRLARELAYHVTLIDRRPGHADAARFPDAHAVLCCPTPEIPSQINFCQYSAAVVMTHNYPEDLELLRILLPSPIAYIGLLGSRQRTARLLSDLCSDHFTPPPEQLNRLHAPVGLDIGAETPAQIALSILAEIQATLANRPAIPLRDRLTPIHDRHAGSCPTSSQ